MIDEENKGFEIFSEIVEFCLEFLELLYKYRVGTLSILNAKVCYWLCCSAIYLVRTERRKQVNH